MIFIHNRRTKEFQQRLEYKFSNQIKILEEPIKNQIELIRATEIEYQKILLNYESEKLLLKKKFLRSIEEIFNKRQKEIQILSTMQNNIHFWMKVLLNSNCTYNKINKNDMKVLKYLNNIDILYSNEELKNIKIRFHFDENEFIKNPILEKEYLMTDDNLIEKITSTKIEWKNKKSLFENKIIRKIKNKKTNEIKEIEEYKNLPSFFNFFYTMQFPKKNEIKNLSFHKEKDLAEFLDEEYETINELKNEILPHASEYFIGINQDNEIYQNYLEQKLAEF